MSSEWISLNLVTIRQGPLPELEILRGVLAEEGIQSTIPDATIKLWDPFITGANSFSCTLQVPLAHRERALATLEQNDAQARDALHEMGDREWAGSEDEPTAEDQRQGELSAVGRRICWAVLFGFTHPFAIYWAHSDFKQLRSVERRPQGKSFVVLALAAMVVSWFAWGFNLFVA
ncbi:hypothetical protein [Engelhardtia mirabilis]|uniref:Uncharacterized protein n=1 Tax=Engelhardtia mirabilis TaxID=2528011 RepID=A0A518BSF3_9BACT|nr:hypothetical protein Pla133_50260 [Planctomycetes bacterium Pla133]QDV04229.1 hypothetical protein Pla86_50240 [Planctomycetes bacterium Pla86]